jgi:hypothetical protein
MVALPWSCLPIVTKKISQKKKYSFCTPPNAVILKWVSVLDIKKMKGQRLARYTRKQYPCAIIEHITTVYLKLVAD